VDRLTPWAILWWLSLAGMMTSYWPLIIVSFVVWVIISTAATVYTLET